MAFTLTTPKQQGRNQFRIWAMGCCHCIADKNGRNRDVITECAGHITGHYGMIPDIGLGLGDYSSGQVPAETPTDDVEGAMVSTQLQSNSFLTRNKIYTIRGNHDAGDQENDWYDKWVDMFGENTSDSGVDNNARPLPITQYGTYDHYSFQKGNILFLMMNDRNEIDYPNGRSGGPEPIGGRPSGTISRNTWNWFKTMVANNYSDKIIVACHHNLLKDTTIATGDNEGPDGNYHSSQGIAIGSGRLESIYDDDLDTYVDSTEILTWMTSNNGKVDLWLGTHTHYRVNETYNGRGRSINKYGTQFLNVGGLTLDHNNDPKDSLSSYVVFNKGSNECNLMQFVHETVDGVIKTGFYRSNDINLTLSKNANW